MRTPFHCPKFPCDEAWTLPCKERRIRPPSDDRAAATEARAQHPVSTFDGKTVFRADAMKRSRRIMAVQWNLRGYAADLKQLVA